MDIWYYVDTAQQRQGPVSAEALVAAVRSGQATDDSLVWREGLAQWGPLRQFRDELGLGGPVQSMPAAPAPQPPTPAEVAAKKNSGCLVIGLVAVGVGGFLIFVLAVLAAIALPAYQDYTIRSKVTAALAEARSLVGPTEQFVQENDRCPGGFDELGLQVPDMNGQLGLELVSLGAGRCVIEVALEGLHASPDLDDRRLYLSRGESGDWECTTDLGKPKYAPTGCR